MMFNDPKCLHNKTGTGFLADRKYQMKFIVIDITYAMPSHL